MILPSTNTPSNMIPISSQTQMSQLYISPSSVNLYSSPISPILNLLNINTIAFQSQSKLHILLKHKPNRILIIFRLLLLTILIQTIPFLFHDLNTIIISDILIFWFTAIQIIMDPISRVFRSPKIILQLHLFLFPLLFLFLLNLIKPSLLIIIWNILSITRIGSFLLRCLAFPNNDKWSIQYSFSYYWQSKPIELLFNQISYSIDNQFPFIFLIYLTLLFYKLPYFLPDIEYNLVINDH